MTSKARHVRVLSHDPFAGSDFWLAVWVGVSSLARSALKELKRASLVTCWRAGIDPNGGYARVVSWMDIDSVRDAGQAAIVLAEAYDAKGKLVKEFEPKGITKVHGQWQLEEMEIRNAKTGSRTSIKFKLDSK